MADLGVFKIVHFNLEARINPGHTVLFHQAFLASRDDLAHFHFASVDHGLEEQDKQVNPAFSGER